MLLQHTGCQTEWRLIYKEMVCNRIITSYWTLISHSQTTSFFDVALGKLWCYFLIRSQSTCTHTSNINKLCYPQNCSTSLKGTMNFTARKCFPPTLYQRKSSLKSRPLFFDIACLVCLDSRQTKHRIIVHA